MERFKTIMGRFFDGVIYAACAIAILVLIGAVCGVKPYITLSGSMEPDIRTGSVCFVNTKADFESIKEGDIIAYALDNGKMVTHRVIAVTAEGLVTKGDSNDVSDGVTTGVENFRGKTIFSVPFAGYVIVYLQKPVCMMMIGVVIIAMVAIRVVETISERKALKQG